MKFRPSLPVEEPTSEQYDVVVFAATPAGIAASVVAAEAGGRVLLIEPTRHVGGMNTNGLNTAETEHMLNGGLGGFAMRFFQRLGEAYGLDAPEFHFESGVAESVFGKMLAEAGVEVRTGLSLERVDKRGTRIHSVRVVGEVGAKDCLGRVFIDASYEGDLMAQAGVTWTIGRESVAEFGEEAAGARFDGTVHEAPTRDASGHLLPGISCTRDRIVEGEGNREVMCYNLRPILTKDPAHRVALPAPSSYDPLRFEIAAGWIRGMVRRGWTPTVGDIVDLYERRNAKLEANNCQAAVFSLGLPGSQSDWCEADAAQRAVIFREHVDHFLGLFYFLGNDARLPESLKSEARAIGLHAGEFGDNGHLPSQIYVREGRRMRGRMVMTQQDVTERSTKEDAIGISTHFIDCHHVRRVEIQPGCFANEGRIWRRGRAYQIPYRALTPSPAECTNLLVPVAASFSHVAYASFRLESIWMVTGHAAGAAAAIAVKEGGDVSQVNIQQLQSRLRQSGQIIDLDRFQTTEHAGGDGGWVET